MTITEAKAEINLRLDREIMGGTDPEVAPDRLKNTGSFRVILDEVAKQGWLLSDISRGEFRVERAYVLRVTRSADHQKLVEDRGEVAVGDNTYEHPHSEQYLISETFRYATTEGNPLSGFEITDAVMAQSLICLAANKAGPRPADRVRNL